MDWQLFADVPPEDVRRLLAIARRRTFARGEVVFHRDDPANALHLIVAGRFAVSITTPLGETALLTVRGPGDAFGELALVTAGETLRSATVSALEPAETRSVFRDDFARLRREHPAVDAVLTAILAERVRRLSERLTEASTAGCGVWRNSPTSTGGRCRCRRRRWPSSPERRGQPSIGCFATRKSRAACVLDAPESSSWSGYPEPHGEVAE